MSEQHEPEEGTVVRFSFWLPLDLDNPMTKVNIQHRTCRMQFAWEDEDDLKDVLLGLEYIVGCAKREREVRREVRDIEGDINELLNKRDEDCDD